MSTLIREFVSLLIKSVLLEGFLQDLQMKNPQKANELQQASNALVEGGLPLDKQRSYLEWLIKFAKDEPYEDLIDDFIQHFNAKKRNQLIGTNADILQLKTSGALRKVLNDLAPEKLSSAKAYHDVVKAYEDDEWVVIMPKSREASIEWAKGTEWCTAKSHGQNLFYTYVAREQDPVILYYVISKFDDQKLSIGVIRGKARLEGSDGGISVNAQNGGLTKQKLDEIIGTQRADEIISKIESHSNSIGNKHPKRELIQKARTSLPTLKFLLNDLENDAIADMLEMIVKSDGILSDNVQDYLVNHNNAVYRKGIAKYYNLSNRQFEKLANDPDKRVRERLVYRRNLTLDQFKIFLNDPNEEIRDRAIKHVEAKLLESNVDLLNKIKTDLNLLKSTYENYRHNVECIHLLDEHLVKDINKGKASKVSKEVKYYMYSHVEYDCFESNSYEQAYEIFMVNVNNLGSDLTISNVKQMLDFAFDEYPNTYMQKFCKGICEAFAIPFTTDKKTIMNVINQHKI